MGQGFCTFEGGCFTSRIVVLGLLFCVSSTAGAEVIATVLLADGETPLELADPNVPFVYRDIMVGTRLTIIISSDVAESLSGLLRTEHLVKYGVVSIREPNDVTPTRRGSIFKSAGRPAMVLPSEDYDFTEVSMNTFRPVMAGDWFLFDYTATHVGNCRIEFYELKTPPGATFDPDDGLEPEPELILLQKLVFSHVPTRDFNSDTKVDFIDFSIMAAFDGFTNCAELDACGGTDLDVDGDVDCEDWMLFADYWLERTQ